MGVKTHFTRYVYFSNISKIANTTANGFANEIANKIANKIEVAGSFLDVSD